LNETNFRTALLASGAIPVTIQGVDDIYGAPRGRYRDGGMIDYGINQRYVFHDNDIALFFNHQKRIIPGWMDNG